MHQGFNPTLTVLEPIRASKRELKVPQTKTKNRRGPPIPFPPIGNRDYLDGDEDK